MCFKVDNKMFHGCFMGVLILFQGCFKEVQRFVQECLKGVEKEGPIKLPDSFKAV